MSSSSINHDAESNKTNRTEKKTIKFKDKIVRREWIRNKKKNVKKKRQ